MIVVLWIKTASKEYRDLLPPSWFSEVGTQDSAEHDVLASDGRKLPARCKITVTSNSAILDYGGEHTGFNRDHDISIGEMKINFADGARGEVASVEWRSDRESEFQAAPVTVNPNEDIEASEGSVRLVQHLHRERDQRLVREKLDDVARRGETFACEACNFDFEKIYGLLGERFCEVHHRVPLSISGPRRTTLSDLAILCANCHRMIHRTDRMEDSDDG